MLRRGATAVMAVGALSTALLPGLYQGNQLGPRVGMVGDSITCLSAKDLQQDFNSDYSYQIGCKNGITIVQGTDYAVAIDKSVQGAPSAFIVNLGTNDALQDEHNRGQADDDDIGATWKAMSALATDLSNVPCVIWVTVSEVPDVYGSRVALGINDWIHSRASSVPGNYELDWWGLLQEGDNAQQWISSRDGIHTTQVGQQELANLYLHAVQHDCPSGSVLPST
jgi:hypothetical protein